MTSKEPPIAFTDQKALDMTCSFSKFAPLTRMIGVGSAAAARSLTFGTGLVPVGFSALKNWFSELNLPGRSIGFSPWRRRLRDYAAPGLGKRFRIVTAAT